MSKSTRNLLRVLSVIIVLTIVLMELDVIPILFNYRIWFVVVAYGLLMLSIRR